MQLAAMRRSVVYCVMLTVSTDIAGCKKTAPDWLVKEYETPAWAGVPGLSVVKTETEDSKVLLIRHRPMSEGLDELFGETYEEPDLESREVIYRYDPDSYEHMFEAVGLRMWVEATGPAFWDLQQERRVPSRMHKPLGSGKLAFGKHGFPIKGNEVMHMAQSMRLGSGNVAILSAKRVYGTPDKTPSTKEMEYIAHKSQDLLEVGGEIVERHEQKRKGITFEEYYHQVYDTKALQLVGSPVPLPFDEQDEHPKCVWAGQDTYVVCTDSMFKRIFIVHRDRLIEEHW